MTSSMQSTEAQTTQIFQAAQQQLIFAQQKLLDPNIPHRIKVLSYIRICCTIIVIFRQLGLCVVPTLNFKTPYISLLSALYQRDIEWWNQCSVTETGYLTSNDPVIRDLLQPLNDLVARQVEERAA